MCNRLANLLFTTPYHQKNEHVQAQRNGIGGHHEVHAKQVLVQNSTAFTSARHCGNVGDGGMPPFTELTPG